MKIAERQRSLTEACSPLFLHLTAFRRNSAESRAGLQELQESFVRDFDDVRARCASDRRLRPLLERAFYALVAAVDQVVLSSAWPHRALWSMNLLETRYFDSSEGGIRFYGLVDEVLSDPTDEAAELAELLFTCMAVGFQGELMGDRAQLEHRRQQLLDKARLRASLPDTLAPEAYGRNARGGMPKLPTLEIMRLVLVAVAAIVFAVMAGNAVTKIKNRTVTAEIQTLLGEIRPSAG